MKNTQIITGLHTYFRKKGKKKIILPIVIHDDEKKKKKDKQPHLHISNAILRQRCRSMFFKQLHT